MMKHNRRLVFFAPLFLCGPLMAGPADAAKHPGVVKHPAQGEPAKNPSPLTPEIQTGAKVVQYGEKDVVKVNAKLRYTSLIILPKNEQILDFTCGDKEFWIVNGSQNFAYVKPAKPGSHTNLNLITASGNVYSFVLAEVSETPTVEPDLKVFVEPKEESMISAANRAPKFVSAQQVEDYRQQAEISKEETRQAKQASQAAIDSGISKFLANVRFPYRF